MIQQYTIGEACIFVIKVLNMGTVHVTQNKFLQIRAFCPTGEAKCPAVWGKEPTYLGAKRPVVGIVI